MNGKGESGQIGQVHCFRIEASHEINVFTSLDKRSHLAKTLFNLLKYFIYIKCAPFIENYLQFMKNCIRPHYEKLKPLKSGFIENSIFENNRDP